MTALEATTPRRQTGKSRAARLGGKELRAPFSLRCGAFLIDYIALISIVVLGTLVARTLGGGARSSGSSAETLGVLVALGAALLNLGLLPGFTGLTLGKWATGLRIEREGGADLGFARALLRHFVGYPLSFLVLGIGFLMTAMTVRGRGLHDIIAGTIVVRESSLPPPHR